MTIYAHTLQTGPSLAPPDLPEFCATCGMEITSASEIDAQECTDCQAKAQEAITIPVSRLLSVEDLRVSLLSDLERTTAARRRIEADPGLPISVQSVYRRAERDLQTALRLVTLYVDANDEAEVIDADEPLPLVVTAAGRALVNA